MQKQKFKINDAVRIKKNIKKYFGESDFLIGSKSTIVQIDTLGFCDECHYILMLNERKYSIPEECLELDKATAEFFEKGDIVIHKVGGPKMLVIAVQNSEFENYIKCKFYNGSGFVIDIFQFEELVKAKNNE